MPDVWHIHRRHGLASKRDMPSRSVLAFAAIWFFGASPASAYRTAADAEGFGDAPVAWRSSRVTVSGDMESAAAIQDAVALWNLQDCGPDLRFVDGDADIRVVRVLDWRSTGLSDREAGSNEVQYLSGTDTESWEIVGAEVWLNDALIRAEGLLTEVVIAHELGHALGLWHPCGEENAPPCDASHASSMMHPLYDGAVRIMPSEDDRAGLCWLYPPSTCDAGCSGQTGDACTTGPECSSRVCSAAGLCSNYCAGGVCPARHECVAGVCEPLARVFGDTCATARECASGICLVRGAGGSCTRECGEGCPGATECGLVDDRAVCVAADSGGCAVGRASHGRASLFVLAIALGMRRRRSRRSQVSQSSGLRRRSEVR